MSAPFFIFGRALSFFCGVKGKRGEGMENKIALIAVVVRELSGAAQVNDLLHEFAPVIVGRMGIPYRDKGVSVISIIADAPPDQISTLAGRLGRISGITVKSVQVKI